MSLTRAKILRENSSPAERRMWRLLFPLRTDGFHFRKQVPIGPYVVDIACHHAGLVIEVDGDTHGTDAAIRRDAVRDAFLRQEGYFVLRFSNLDVRGNPEGVFSVVIEALEGKPRRQRPGPTPSPALPTRGRVTVGDLGKAPNVQPTQPDTLPLVGRAGEGEATDSVFAEVHRNG